MAGKGRRRPGRSPGLSRGKVRLGAFLAALLLAALFFAAGRLDLWEGGQKTASTPPSQDGAAVSTSTAEKSGLEVYFLDVGQGDSALVRHTGKDGAGANSAWTMLIDTGEYAYADGLTQYLRNLGVERLDALVCSHPHTDHMGCMARIVQRFAIGCFYMPHVSDSVTPTTSAYEALLDALSEKEDLSVTALHRGTVIDCPAELSLNVLAPRLDADWDDLNNWSAVLRLTYGETSFLFTGDAESQSEKCILEDAETLGLDLTSTVLKCGHHGSKTSTSAAFLRAVMPQYTVISCGADNDYGHPHEGTLEKLEKIGTAVYRTDEDGTVLAKSDGKSIAWETGLASVQARAWD